MIEKILKLLVRIKMYMARSMTYVGMINSAMILFLLLSNLEKYGIDIDLKSWMIPLVIIGIVVLVVWGFIEDQIGLWRYEQKVSTDRNYHTNEILKKLTDMEKRVEVMEKWMNSHRPSRSHGTEKRN